MKCKARRKILLTLLTVSLVFSSTCVTNEQGSYAYAATTWDVVKGEKLADAIAEADAYHTKQQTQEGLFEDMDNLLNYNTAETVKISQSEVKALLTSTKRKKSLTYKAAVSDVDLFFRALKYAYGAYEYFGGDERFNQAKQEVLNKLKDKKTVSRKELTSYLQKGMRFIVDGHFTIEGLCNANENNYAYRYYYDYEHRFNKDEKGYYKTKNGKKWYYKSCSNRSMRLEKTLTPDGEIVYSPVLFCKTSGTVNTASMTLVNGSKKKTEKIRWKEQEAFRKICLPVLDFKYLKKEKAAYISVRSFENELKKDLLKFEKTGISAKDASLIIFDVRSNGGGSELYARNWFKNYTGRDVKESGFFFRHTTALNSGTYGNEISGYDNLIGEMADNDTPVIVLVDDKCGSAGGSIVQFLQTIKNVIVIGGNSCGAQLCGNVCVYTLPKSGISFSFGDSLSFKYSMDNIDGKGYEPDVWCNPSNAVKAVINMLKKQDYISKETADYFKKNTEDRFPEVTLKYCNMTINVDNGFGCITDETVDVLCNGKVIKNYMVRSSNASEISAKKLPNGKVRLKASKEGYEVKMTVKYKGRSYVFYPCS